MAVEFGKTAGDYARHRAGFPSSLFERLATFGIGQPGQEVVDVGTGTGTVACNFARRGCHVVGVDRSSEMAGQARELDAGVGVHVDYRVGTAEATGLQGGGYDVFSAGQCWHWFDRQLAAAEARRLLRPGGAIVICHFDWLPLPGSVAAATEPLVLRHNPKWGGAGGCGMYPQWAADVSGAGFAGIETFSYDLDVHYTATERRAPIRAGKEVSNASAMRVAGTTTSGNHIGGPVAATRPPASSYTARPAGAPRPGCHDVAWGHRRAPLGRVRRVDRRRP